MVCKVPAPGISRRKTTIPHIPGVVKHSCKEYFLYSISCPAPEFRTGRVEFALGRGDSEQQSCEVEVDWVAGAASGLKTCRGRVYARSGSIPSTPVPPQGK